MDGPEDYVDADFEPGTCCKNEEGVCTNEYINSTNAARKSGCAVVIADVIRRIALEIGCYSTVSAVLQLLEIICVFFSTMS